MFEVAFSRRMCCSRVCRVRTKPRLPSRSRVSPAILPGMRRISASLAAKKPNEGPPKSRWLPRVWPSPTAMSTPHSPGVRSSARGSGPQLQIVRAPASRAEEVRLLGDEGRDVLIERRRLGDAVLDRRLHDLDAPTMGHRPEHFSCM